MDGEAGIEIYLYSTIVLWWSVSSACAQNGLTTERQRLRQVGFSAISEQFYDSEAGCFGMAGRREMLKSVSIFFITLDKLGYISMVVWASWIFLIFTYRCRNLNEYIKVGEAIKINEKDGWYLVRQKGSYMQFKYTAKKGVVAIANHKLADGIAKGTVASILKQAQL